MLWKIYCKIYDVINPNQNFDNIFVISHNAVMYAGENKPVLIFCIWAP